MAANAGNPKIILNDGTSIGLACDALFMGAMSEQLSEIRFDPVLGGMVPVAPSFKRVAFVSGEYDMNGSESLIAVTGTLLVSAVVLLAAANAPNQWLIVKDEGGNASAHNITISVAGGGTIDGASTYVISTNYGFVRLYSNGTAWFRCG